MTKYCEISGSKIRDPEPFKAGDRVRLIGCAAGDEVVDGRRGTVTFADGGITMEVKMDDPLRNGKDVVIAYTSKALKLKPQVRK